MKVRVAAIITKSESILLVKHCRRGLSYWAFPGGSVQESETIVDALRRELLEETGLSIETGHLLYVVETIDPSRTGVHTINLFFLANVIGEIGDLAGQPSPGEHLDVPEFVPLAEMSKLELYPDIGELVKRSIKNRFHEGCKYLGNLWSENKD